MVRHVLIVAFEALVGFYAVLLLLEIMHSLGYQQF